MAGAAGVAPLALSATQQVQGATARRPRALLKAGGQSLPLKSFRCDENSFYQANTFHAALAFSAMPAGYGLEWWSDQDQIDVEIFAGFPPDPSHFTTNDLESLFYGRVDAVEDIALDAGTFAISGRDLTGRMIDTKTSEKYPNLTASQIAGLLAAKYGLTPVITPTATKVGRYYEVDSVRSQSDRTEWDLLTWLAREEVFNVFVRRRELHFGPAGGEGTPYVLTYRAPTAEQTAAANATAIKLSRNLTLTKRPFARVPSLNAPARHAARRAESPFRPAAGAPHDRQSDQTACRRRHRRRRRRLHRRAGGVLRLHHRRRRPHRGAEARRGEAGAGRRPGHLEPGVRRQVRPALDRPRPRRLGPGDALAHHRRPRRRRQGRGGAGRGGVTRARAGRRLKTHGAPWPFGRGALFAFLPGAGCEVGVFKPVPSRYKI